jgi:hypothetical protein
MYKFDLRSLTGKDISEVINFADDLSKQDLEGKLNAYRIYQSLI